ncbi:MAG TPA: hypothetical protein VMS89_07600 [Methanoregulaceae archaeon]|nr:hypothetical protein [Methanoregulaceae archaeon]
MELDEFLQSCIKARTSEGSYRMNDLKKFAAGEKISGVAVAVTERGTVYLLFSSGEPQGAVEIDKTGILIGDKAVFLLKGNEIFSFYLVEPELIDRWILTCRIFDRSHLNSTLSPNIPVIERKNEGMGSFAIQVLKDNSPQSGLHVSIRKQGRVIGSDVTTGEGKAYFKLLFGDYDIVIMDKDKKMQVFRVKVHSGGREETISLR